jgi:hypothetical protein
MEGMVSSQVLLINLLGRQAKGKVRESTEIEETDNHRLSPMVLPDQITTSLLHHTTGRAANLLTGENTKVHLGQTIPPPVWITEWVGTLPRRTD